MTGLEELRRRYPWPDQRPQVPDDCTGWFSETHQAVLGPLLSQRTRVVFELGSFQGLSTQWFVKAAPRAAIICVDHWQGSIEHHRHPEWKAKLPLLYETFLRNLWPSRGRVVPMRTSTQQGLPELHRLAIRPDLIYVDASHAEEDVRHDVSVSLELFAGVPIVGDDWTQHSVRMGVVRAAAGIKYLEVTGSTCWHLKVEERRC